MPLSHCLDVRQTYQSPPRPPSINAGDIPSRERARRNLFRTTMSTRAYPILAPIMVPHRSPTVRGTGEEPTEKWCKVMSWFWILSCVLRSAIWWGKTWRKVAIELWSFQAVPLPSSYSPSLPLRFPCASPPTHFCLFPGLTWNPIILFWSLYHLPKCTSREGLGKNRYPAVTQLPPGTWPSKMLNGSTATETMILGYFGRLCPQPP